MAQATDREIKETLERRGHYALNWEDLDKIEFPTGVVSSMYRVGDPTRPESPTVFKVFYPPGCTIEAHTHDCDYTEIILEGSQRVGATWHQAGDIRIGLANRGYGPLVAGPEGANGLSASRLSSVSSFPRPYQSVYCRSRSSDVKRRLRR